MELLVAVFLTAGIFIIFGLLFVDMLGGAE